MTNQYAFSFLMSLIPTVFWSVPVLAEEWIEPNGGDFGMASNWDPPSVPSFSDDAVFNLDSTYTVDFNQDFENESLLINQGDVTFDLNGQMYELTEDLFLDFSIAVGESSGDDAGLTITNGQLIGVRSSIGIDDGAQGMVTVSDGGEWTNEALFVGGGDPFPGGAGTLEISGGGTVTNNIGRIANVQGSSGQVTVSGTGSLWDSNFHSVGHEGTGTMDITAGAMVDTLASTIGFEAGSDGTATVSGTGSTWSITQVDAFIVGRDGSGTLTVENSGTVDSNGAQVAVGEDSTGIVTVSGTDSIWTDSGQFIVADEGDGTLTIEDGGTIESGGSAESIIGNRPDSTGTVTVTGPGSTWNNFGRVIRIGNDGNGTLTIEEGGIVENGGADIAALPGSIGSVTVSGAGSTWDNLGAIFVGRRGMGTLTIEVGGTVESNEAFLGFADGLTGTVTVSGTGSTWTIDETLIVSREGEGALMIENGGRVENVNGRIGLDDPAGIAQFEEIGNVSVMGANSTWVNSGFLHVGGEGPGTLTIADGGSVENKDGVLAQFSRATGRVTVTGPGSTWTNNGNLTVGDQGEGTLTIQGGGMVENMDASVGFMPDSIGNVTVTGSGSNWITNGTLSIGATSPGCGTCGTATVTIQTGGKVHITEDTTLNLDSTLHLGGGALTTTQIDLQGGEFQWTAGTLHIDQFDGDLTNSAGILAPGRTAPTSSDGTAGSTTILGDYTQQSAATLELEIGGTATATEHDFVNVTGTAMFGGDLELTLINNFLPDASDDLIVLNADNLFNFFSNVGNGQRLDTVDGIGSFLVHYGPTSAFNPDQVVLTDFEIVNLPADFDNDGDVDGVDVAQWQGDYGANGMSDADGDGDSDGADFLVWQRRFGSGVASTAAVPEPASLMLLGLCYLAGMMWRCERRLTKVSEKPV